METSYYDFLTNINERVLRRAKENNHGRNYIRLFRPYNPHKLNVMGTFEDAVWAEGGRANTFGPNSRSSFGMIATEQFHLYRSMATSQESPFGDAQHFSAYLERNYRNFCVDRQECKRAAQAKPKTWQKALYARCILAACRAFCFTLHFHNEEDRQFVQESLEKDHSCLVEYTPAEKHLLTVYGRPTDDVLSQLTSFSIQEQGNLLFVCREATGDCFSALYSERFASAYSCKGNALYSGVIPRLVSVMHQEPSLSNAEIEKLMLHTGRTSYLTMYGMARTDVLSHPFMQQIMEEGKSLAFWNELFDQSEVAVQEIYFERMQKIEEEHRGIGAAKADTRFQEELQALNDYLKSSWNVHNINISGNLITSDDYCLYTQRGSYIEDAGNFYCSVNGGSEIQDDKVDFYSASVEEDIPSIAYTDKPYYFGGELTREAIGELGIIDTSRVWKYYGITAMGHRDGPDDTHRIWLHFNVLGARHCTDTFDKIAEQKAQAAENFESVSLMGYQLILFQSKKEKMLQDIRNITDMLLEQKDLLMLLAVFVLCRTAGKNFFDADNVLSLIFVCLAVLSMAMQISAYLRSRKNKHVFSVVANRSCIPYDWYTSLFKKGHEKNADAVLLYLTQLRMDKVFYE